MSDLVKTGGDRLEPGTREHDGEPVFSVAAEFIEQLDICMRREHGQVRTVICARCEVPRGTYSEDIRRVVESGAVVMIETPLGGAVPVMLTEVTVGNFFYDADLRSPFEPPRRRDALDVTLEGELVHLKGPSDG